jgi:hypothetical protein
VISAPGVTATPSVSVSRLVAAAQLLGAAVVAAPGMLESIADSRGEVRDNLLGLLDCVDEYEALMARPPIRRPV